MFQLGGMNRDYAIKKTSEKVFLDGQPLDILFAKTG
jgi:hypothetical protein